MLRPLETLQSRFFAWTQLRQMKTVQTGDLTRELGFSPEQEKKLLSNLARRGLIARVRRGLYLVPERLPVGGQWSPGEILALNTLVSDQDGKYQICGPVAFGHFGWDQQVANRICVYNNRISGERKIGSIVIQLIKVSDNRLGSIERVTTSDNEVAVFSSRSRSLVDAVYDWSRFNTLPRAYSWIVAEIESDSSFAKRLVRDLLLFGNTGTIRRCGRLLTTLGVHERLLKKLERALKPTKALIPYIPGKAKRGRVDRRWGVLCND